MQFCRCMLLTLQIVIGASLSFLPTLTLAQTPETSTAQTQQTEDEFHWEVDLGLVVEHSRGRIRDLDYTNLDIQPSLWVAGGVYYKRFFVESAPIQGRNLTLGYTLRRTNSMQLNLIAGSWFGPISEEYQDEGTALNGIQERESTIEAGIELIYQFKDVDMHLRVMHDALARHKGSIVSIDMSKPLFTKTMLIQPTLGVTYISSNTTDYYYGISAAEATVDRPEYTAGSAWALSARVYVERPLSESWSIIGTASYSHASHEVHDSPIVNTPDAYNVSLGALWVF